MEKVKPLQQKLLIPVSLNNIHNNRITTPKDIGTNRAITMDHQEKYNNETTLNCDGSW
jgi:hypothetical protein